MSKNGLLIPLCEVQMQDGAVWEIQPDGRDSVAWDLYAAKRKLPEFTKIQSVWLTYLAWSASRRERLLPADMTFERFSTAEHRQVAPANMDELADKAAAADAADEDGPLDAAGFPEGQQVPADS